MAANEIAALIEAALPGAAVTIDDLAGDGDHYRATVVSDAFAGKIGDRHLRIGQCRANQSFDVGGCHCHAIGS